LLPTTSSMPHPSGKFDLGCLAAEGLRHPYLLAADARQLDALGRGVAALVLRACLALDGRCVVCGRRLSSARTVALGVGRYCRN
jgi:Family of unknown function (DUF6011)